MSNVARKLIHDEFNVTSTSPTEGGFTLFKVKSGSEEEEELVNRLRRRFPLSGVSLVQDDLQGTSSIHMLVPSEEELESQAVALAKARRSVRVLRVSFRVSLALLLLVAGVHLARRFA
tara:strand:+ start:396 stop:749 length:354 start_codon:yes stop_codon:yes gene_type:complete